MDGQPADDTPAAPARNTSKVKRRDQTAAARAAKLAKLAAGEPESGSLQDTSENGSDSRSNSAVMARPKRAVSPSLSILSNGSGDADYTPSASGNRLVKLRAALAVAQGFRPVHIPSLSAALKHHIVCPICMRKDVVTASCDEEVSLGVAGILQFRCSHCQEATIQVPTSPAIPGKRNAQLQALNLRCVLAAIVAGMSEGGCARFLDIAIDTKA